MTVSSSTYRNTYNGNGVTSSFSYTFRILSDDDIAVQWKDTSTGVITTKTKTTHYTVSSVGESAGGNVVFTVGNIPPSGTVVIFLRSMDFLQETDYTEYDSFPAETHETALDKLTMESQQLKESLDRTFVLDPSAADTINFNYTLADPTGYAGYLITVNSTEDGFEYRTATSNAIFTVPAGTGILVKDSADTSVVRTLTGTSGKISVTNGDGVSGNPTITLPSAIDLSTHTVSSGKFYGTSFVDSSDNTKVLQYNLSGIPTATTRTAAWQDSDGTVALLGNTLDQFASTTSAQLASVISDETGSGALVFGTSPTVSGVSFVDTSDATKVLRYDLSAIGTGTTRIVSWQNSAGTVALLDNRLDQFASTTSAQLKTVISDETGSGALVFGTSPTLASMTLSGTLAASGTVTLSGTFSGGTVNGLTGTAAASDQETGTSTALAVTPSVQHRHISAAKAWVIYNTVTSTNILGSYNVSSLTDNSAGNTDVNFTTSFSSTNYAGTASSTGVAPIAYLGPTPSTSATTVITSTTVAQTDAPRVSAVFFGDQ